MISVRRWFGSRTVLRLTLLAGAIAVAGLIIHGSMGDLFVGMRLWRHGASASWRWGRIYKVTFVDGGLSHEAAELLVQLPELKKLSIRLPYPYAADAGLEHLDALDGLNDLFISGALSDRDVRQLKGPKTLSCVTLYLSKIGDAGLIHLSIFPRLREVRVYRSEVTQEGVTTLQNALPNVKIGWEGHALDGDLI